MGKQEFIDRLRTALNGRISPKLVLENVNYYEDYINTQIRLGRSESEVLEELGDPRLIAKTIITASGQENNDVYERTDNRENEYRGAGTQYNTQDGNKPAGLPGWFWIVFSILVIILVLGVVLSVLSFLLPIVIPILVVLFLVKLFRDWLN